MPASAKPAVSAGRIYTLEPTTSIIPGMSGYGMTTHDAKGGRPTEQHALNRHYIVKMNDGQRATIYAPLTDFSSKDIRIEQDMRVSQKPVNLALDVMMLSNDQRQPFSVEFESLRGAELRYRLNISNSEDIAGTLRVTQHFASAEDAETFLASKAPLIGQVSIIDNKENPDLVGNILASHAVSGITAADLQRSRAAYNAGKNPHLRASAACQAMAELRTATQPDMYANDTISPHVRTKALLTDADFVKEVTGLNQSAPKKAPTLPAPSADDYTLKLAMNNKVEQVEGLNRGQALLVVGNFYENTPQELLAQLPMLDGKAGPATKQAILNLMEKANIPAPANGVVDVKAFVAELAKGKDGRYASQLREFGGRADQLLSDAMRNEQDRIFNPSYVAHTVTSVAPAPQTYTPAAAPKHAQPQLPATNITIPTPANDRQPAKVTTVEDAQEIGKVMEYLKVEAIDPKNEFKNTNTLSSPVIQDAGGVVRKLSLR